MKYHNYPYKAAVDIGMMVHQARVGKGLSQAALAAKCRMSQETVARIENGGTLPTLRTLLRLAEGMDTTLMLPYFRGMGDVISYRQRNK